MKLSNLLFPGPAARDGPEKVLLADFGMAAQAGQDGLVRGRYRMCMGSRGMRGIVWTEADGYYLGSCVGRAQRCKRRSDGGEGDW